MYLPHDCILMKSYFHFVKNNYIFKDLYDIPHDIFSVQVTEDHLDLQGGVWSLDGSEELRHTMTTLLAKPDSSSDLSEQPTKVAKMSTTYCGVVSLQGLDHHMSQAYKLGVSLATYLSTKGADQILKAAKEQNNPNITDNNPNSPLEKKETKLNNS